MTGYGREEFSFNDKTIVVEIRSLNSKFTDLRFKIPQNYRIKESELRKHILSKIERGKIDLSIEVKSEQGDEEYALNGALFKKYYQELRKLAVELDLEYGDLIQAILRLPNVVAVSEDLIDEEEWGAVLTALNNAIEKFSAFRLAEGGAMKKDAETRIHNILSYLNDLPPLEQERLQRLRDKIWQNVEEFVGKEKVDGNRFEQEILYYLEKIDITEEKVRLEQHCKYFLEELGSNKVIKGRKLSFISQEMGREINTLGAKANSSDIQKVVVGMKDDLEKIKEVLANVV